MAKNEYGSFETPAVLKPKSIKDAGGMQVDPKLDSDIHSAVLATAVVRLKFAGQVSPPIRAMCDTGAQLNLISSNFVKQLGWATQQCRVRFGGIDGMCGGLHKEKLICELISRFTDEALSTIEFIMVPQVIGQWLPSSDFSEEVVPKGIQSDMADPTVYRSAPITAILGAGVWGMIIKDGSFRNEFGMALQPSRLGWLLFGGGTCENKTIAVGVNINKQTDDQLDPLLRRLWEIEQISPVRIRTIEQEQCEDFFMATYQRLETGRHEVGIPLQNGIERLGSSRAIALHRYHQLERRFKRDPELKKKYTDAMSQMIREDHIRLVNRPSIGPCYHIPHHPVLKKFRVVFDGSCKTDLGMSVNEAQLTGERLQDDLSTLIMRFRYRAVAVTADVKKMYLQVKVRPEQWDLQRIFYRPDDDSEIKEYWITVVTFGMSSAPFCAVRAMIEGARMSRAQFPKGAEAIENDYYMDDCLSGAETIEDARQMCSEMDTVQRSYGFILDKWRSNYPNVVPYAAGNKEVSEVVDLEEFADTTVLGLRWIPKTDELMFKFQPPPELTMKEATKRRMLSHIATIFDPNGYLGPVVIVAKILMQKLWRVGVEWDQIVPNYIYREWQTFREQLHLVAQIRIPRWLGVSKERNISLHGFADASQSAYGAVLYMRVESAEHIDCILIASRSRVAPVKTITIPRLELCAAYLLSELVASFENAIKRNDIEKTFWSDSAIVLAWLVKDAATLKTFVNNRVQKINRLTKHSIWRYVPSEDNPADLLSRGISPAQLQDARYWWKGPIWLTRANVHWPDLPTRLSKQMEVDLEAEMKSCDKENFAKLRVVRKTLLAGVGIQLRNVGLMERASDANELFRLTAWVNRFISNCRQYKERQQKGPLRNKEIDDAIKFWIRREQQIYYAKEIQILNENELKGIEEKVHIDPVSAILQFNPFMRKNEGIIRKGGRLGKALISFEQKYPALLPDVSPLAKLLVRQAHMRTLHGGYGQMAAFLRQKFWITNLRRLVHTNNSRCTRCIRYRQECVQQMMADLPKDRVVPCRAFRQCGVDYAGPFDVKVRGTRSRITEKKYVAVFVCMVTKAVHLELVEDLTTVEFIQAFLRFTSIRGACTRLWSDNGRNFVGAEKELERMLKSWDQMNMSKKLQEYGTEWRFITPSAPHHGGLWEAAVKSMKFHLRRVIGKETLTNSAFRTILAQTSAAMNSRPLAALTEDPEGLEFLTPAHLFLGESIIQPFGANVQDSPDTSLKLAARIQKKSQLIWRAWSQDYLNELQQRSKWKTAHRNLQPGDLVLVKEESTPPTLWRTGRVTEIFPGADGLVRTVRLQVSRQRSGTACYLVRPIQKLCLLLPNVEAEPSRGQDVAA